MVLVNCAHAESFSVFGRFWSPRVISAYYGTIHCFRNLVDFLPVSMPFEPSAQKGMGREEILKGLLFSIFSNRDWDGKFLNQQNYNRNIVADKVALIAKCKHQPIKGLNLTHVMQTD